MTILYAFLFLLSAILLSGLPGFNAVKKLFLFGALLFFSTCLYAQSTTQTGALKSDSVKKLQPAPTSQQPLEKPATDTPVTNKYGYLLNDDKSLNKRYPIWKPFVEVLGVDVFTWSLDRFVLNEDFSHIGPATWKYNLRKGWEWDDDRFGVNFIAHPYSGSMYFNAARSQGYNYLQSIPFAAGGSLMWEYFGENTRPSYNDIINTTTNGAFLGEVFYRLSSNILDDRTTGGERFLRELAAGLVDPVRGLNRLLQGKSFRKTKGDAYQKEPLNITLDGGIHKINVDNYKVFGAGPTNALINLQFDYGDPFADRIRKPFDFFKFRTEFSFGSGRKILDNIIGYGILFGNKTSLGDLSVLYGAFQYYDYWDNKTFELGALGLGGGVITQYPISDNVVVFTSAHLAGVPLAGNSTRFGPDTSQVRDYTYNDGLEAKFSTSINFAKLGAASLEYYYYVLHAFYGPASNNHISILKPRLTIQLFKNVNIGFEHFIYYDNRYIKNFPAIYSVRTEQKLFLSLFLEDTHKKEEFVEH